MPKQKSWSWIEEIEAKVIGTSAGLIVMALWNLASAILRLGFEIWKYGAIVLTVLAIAALIFDTWPWNMLDDFLDKGKNRHARLALMAGASLLFYIATFALYGNIILFRD